MGVSEDFGRITQFSVVTERGSEYNIVERENSRKMTANGGGGVITILQSPGGVITILQSPWGRGGKRIRQILFDTTKTIPSPTLPRK